ncbi:LysR family transcriptional regulator [Achromobacter aloeverae]
MSLRALRTLIAISEQGSFVRAAQSISLTQSAVSLQVRRLEADFQTELFDRSCRIPVLTEKGQLLVDCAREIVGLYDGLHHDLEGLAELVGSLRLGAVHSALVGMLPAALARLRSKHLRFKIMVSSGLSAELAKKVIRGELDAAVVTEPAKPCPTSLVVTPLYDEEFWIVWPTGPAPRQSRVLLESYPFISFNRHSWTGKLIDRELRRQHIKVRACMELDNSEMILKMVSKGLGAAVVPLSEPNLRVAKDLGRMRFGDYQNKRRVVLIQKDGPSVNSLIGALVAEIKDQAAPVLTVPEN